MSNNTVLPRLTQLAASIAVAVGGLAFVPAANAAAPLAGTSISNVATASYTDASARAQTVTSNIVQATVIQVASFKIEADRTVNALPNGQVTLPHTLTNLGNGSDTFTINVADVTTGDNFDFGTGLIKVYRDADGNGQADDNINLAGQTVTLAAGQALNLVVVTTVPAGQTVGTNGKLTISAQSSIAVATSETITTKSNTDTVNVTSNAIIKVDKSITGNISSVKTGDVLEYVLTYTNTGNNTATNVILKDILPDYLVYQASSGRWSTGATALTDAIDADKYKFDATTGEISFVVDSVAPNTTGTLKFKVTVGAASKGAASTATGAYVPAGQIQNKALFSYDPDGVGTTPQTTDTPTNTSTVTVTADYSGAINDSSISNYNDNERVITDATKDDSQTIAINQGQPATFTTYVWNRGNTSENYNISSVLVAAGLPAGTQVQFFKADGATPLTDSNSDQISDVGPIAPGTYAAVVVKVTPPPTYTGTGGSVTVTARPLNNSALSDSTTLVVNVTAASVDLSKSNLGTPADGSGAYVSGTIVQSVTTNPGAPATFQLAITNGASSGIDNFNLGLDTALPAGWTVVFYEADNAGICSNNVITNTGNLAAGATKKVCAVVTPTGTAVAGTQDVVFTINSPASGLNDKLKDQVVINTVRSFTFEPPRSGQILPGGTITYSHTLTNTGNVSETITGADITVATNPNANTTLFIDLNSDGIAQSNEQIVGGVLPAGASSTLVKGASLVILAKIEAASNATDGQQYVTTVTVTPTAIVGVTFTPTALQVVDTTTVNDGQVRLAKQQVAVDCTSGLPTGSAVYGTGTISAKPGTCVAYKVTATNDGSVDVTKLVISDTTPSFTKFVAITGVSPKVTNATINVQPANGATGTVNTAEKTLTPSASASLEFVVKIDN